MGIAPFLLLGGRLFLRLGRFIVGLPLSEADTIVPREACSRYSLLRCFATSAAYFKRRFSSASRLLTCCTARLRTLPSLSTSTKCGRNMMPYCVASGLSRPPAWNNWMPAASTCCKKLLASSAVLPRLPHTTPHLPA